MDVINIINNIQKIKGYLIFFCVCPFFMGCLDSKKSITPILGYENEKAVRVSFKSEGDITEFSIYRSDNQNVSILGSFSEKEDSLIFTPAIPFQSGHEFGISYQGKQLAKFKVKPNEVHKVPELLAYYPRHDTVPVNILKSYLIFSQPMQYVGNPLKYIRVFDQTEDKEVFPFLDLEAELWDKDHKRLTLWFDPGRIKTGLIPNTEKGLPLKVGHTYDIVIDKNWKSSNGNSLLQSYTKTIHVIGRDIKSPRLDNWIITAPQKNTNHPIKISFNEVLDPILALESIKLFRGDIPVSGTLKPSETDDAVLFAPNEPWKVGSYHLLINPILEDLAGNNFYHLFDSDLGKPIPKKEISTRIGFEIQ